jgi:hypothetical protein
LVKRWRPRDRLVRPATASAIVLLHELESCTRNSKGRCQILVCSCYAVAHGAPAPPLRPPPKASPSPSAKSSCSAPWSSASAPTPSKLRPSRACHRIHTGWCERQRRQAAADAGVGAAKRGPTLRRLLP